MSATGDAFLTAVDSVADLLARTQVATAWDEPSALAEWSVGGLAGHLAGQAFAGVNLIEAEPSELTPIALDEHYERVTWIGAAVDDEQSVDIRSGGDANAEAGPEALLARVVQARDRLGVLLADTSPDRPVLVPWQGWALRRDDFLVMRMMEITVHSDDLAASVGITRARAPRRGAGSGARPADPSRRTPPRPVRRRRRVVPRRAGACPDQRVLTTTAG